MRNVEVTKEFRFESAHQLPDHSGPCAALHGHSYRLEVTVAGPLNEHGMVIDFDHLATIVRRRIIDRLDHTLLNNLIKTPTAENIALTAWDWLEDDLPQLRRIVIHETAHNRATVTAP